MEQERLKEVTEEELAAQGVVAAPNILTGTPTENKKIFDHLVAGLIAPKVNEVVRRANALIDAETVREGKETERIANEEKRETAEEERAAAERLRIEAEKKRLDMEQSRNKAETERVAAEKDRAAAETERISETQGIVAQAATEAKRAEDSAAVARDEARAAESHADRAEEAARAAVQARAEAEAVAAGDLSLMMRRHNEDPNAHGRRCRVIRVRVRDPSKPDYGLGGGGDDGGDETPVLRVKGYTGTAEVSAVVSGVEYDAINMSVDGENVPDGTLIIKEKILEE